MPMAKKNESGVDAAVARLTTPSEVPVQKNNTEAKVSKPRDFDAEARGKTRCSTWNAVVASPSLAGMKWSNPTEFLALVREIAEDGVKFTFGE